MELHEFDTGAHSSQRGRLAHQDIQQVRGSGAVVSLGNGHVGREGHIASLGQSRRKFVIDLRLRVASNPGNGAWLPADSVLANHSRRRASHVPRN